MNQCLSTRALPADPGPSAWREILDPGPSFAPLQSDIDADWVVVGAGFAGLAAAWRLSQLVNGERIVVLEAGRVAEGPAGRNSGFMIDLPHELNSTSYAGATEKDAREIRLHRAAIDFAATMAADCQLPSGVFDRCGKVTAACAARGEQHLVDYEKHLQAMGETYETLSAQDLREYTGIDFYTRGLFTPHAAMVQPAAFIQGVAAGLSPSVTLHECSPVTAFEPGHQGARHSLTTPQGVVRTPRVILAVNGLIQRFGYFPGRLLHVFTYASMTRALAPDEIERLGGQSDWGIIPADPMGTTVRRTSDLRGSGHRLVVRNHGTLNQSYEASGANMRRAAKLQDQAFKNRFPMLSGVEFEYRWGGRLCLSLNSVPAFGELEPGVFSACCQNGLGTVKGTLAGMMAAELATGTDSELLQSYQTFDAPKKLPPEPFLGWGANATMRWREYKAGIEL